MKKLVLGITFLAVPFLVSAADPPSNVCATPGNAVLEVNGTKLTLTDLEQKNPSLLYSAQNAYYEAERKAVDGFVGQYLLEQQAKAEGLTVDQLLDKHVKSTIAKDPSEEALRVYYEGLDTTQPYEAVRGQIIEALHQRRIARAKAAYLETLRHQANINVLLTPPDAKISLKNADLRGPQTAPVVVVEYADYECPYCQQAQPTLDKIEAAYKGRIAFVFKDMPLPMHSHAEKAAEASRCAEAQGKYWEYHDALFAKKQLDVTSLKQTARDLKLDGAAFDKCLDSGATVPGIQASSEEATSLGVQGTPTLFINGHFFSANVSFEGIQAAIDQELHKLPTTAQIAQR